MSFQVRLIPSFGLLLLVTACLSPVSAAESFEQAKARMKREHEQRVKEMQAEATKFKAKAPSFAKPLVAASAKPTVAAATVPARPAFNPQSAPPPEQCLDAHLKAARAASSMSQMLSYLPPAERSSLESRQKNFDPKQAAERRQKYVKEGKLDQDAILHLTSSPYDTSLKHLKTIANKVLSIDSVKVQGNQATIQVSIRTDTVINGEQYARSTAQIGMKGEGNRWYLSTFGESDWVTK